MVTNVEEDKTVVYGKGTSFPASPIACQGFHRTDQNKLYFRNAANTAWIEETSIFGCDFQYVESEGEQINGTTSYVLKTGASLQWTPPEAGDYIVEYTYERTTDDTSEEINAIVELDNGGTPQAGTELNYDSHEPENSNEYQMTSGFKKLTLTAAAHRIDISFRSSDSGCDAKIRRCRIKAWRVA